MSSRVPLLAVLILGASLRVMGLGWGVPRYDDARARGTALRTTYHPDEDRMLWQLERMRPEVWDFDPKDYGWGTLETYLVGMALAGADAAGVFPEGWREAFRRARFPDSKRIFQIGRLLSASFGVATLLLVYVLAREHGGERAGLWATLVLAVSPLHVVHSHFLTTDVALAFWLTLALLLLRRNHHRGAGFVTGLALATKSTALFFLPVLPLTHAAKRPSGWWHAYPLIAAGFLCGEPYALLAFPDWLHAMTDLLRNNTVLATGTGPFALYARHGFQLACYGLGPLAVLLALSRVFGSRGSRLLLTATTTWALSLGLTWLPMARYEIPLLPWLAVAAGGALARLPKRAAFVAAPLAILPPLLLSLAQISVMREPHTADAAARWIVQVAPPGASIVQLWPEYPILDNKRYRLSLFEDPSGFERKPFRPVEADLAIIDDLRVLPLREELVRDLERNFTLAATFRKTPRLGPFVIPEPGAPHDWKYTHPEIRIYRRNTHAIIPGSSPKS